MFTCDKCGELVSTQNDAVALEVMRQHGKRIDPLTQFVYGARHLLPTSTCEGSPSRAQYLEGQPRDTRGYEYDEDVEAEYRAAYERLA